ncbi:MAG: D-TA family PLP-dependent enzyme [Caldithrix sp.]|nr:D-TA family PLP-dependent enzyme [Caldithrix sp.]
MKPDFHSALFIDPSQIKILHNSVDTPGLLISDSRLQSNIQSMQYLAQISKCRMRPHIKTHKSAEIALRQLKAGAIGITTAKLSEAEIFAEQGIADIFIANQITHRAKIKRLYDLHQNNRLIIGIDHTEQIKILADVFQDTQHPLEVRIEVDSGLNRCGIQNLNQLITLAREIKKFRWLKLEGIFTHAGQAYGGSNPKEIRNIGLHEGNLMVYYAKALAEHGIDIDSVSVGSTPTVPHSASINGINEIRPGNYVFHDAIQVALQTVRPDRCSLLVMATVISKTLSNRIIVDAGSKALNLDKGAHSKQLLPGYGIPLNLKGTISALSEEHGMIDTNEPAIIEIGDPVIILPNHACAVVNLYDTYHWLDKDNKIHSTPITARGKSQ